MPDQTERQAIWIAYALNSFSNNDIKMMIQALSVLIDSKEVDCDE